MGRGKFKGKPTGQRRFSSAAEILAGTSAARPRSFKQKDAEYEEDVEEEESEEESEDESEDESDVKKKGHEALIEVDNPNRAKPKTLKARDLDASKTTELSRREREELEKQRAHERYMRLQEQGKTEQAKKKKKKGFGSSGSDSPTERRRRQDARRGKSSQRREKSRFSQMRQVSPSDKKRTAYYST